MCDERAGRVVLARARMVFHFGGGGGGDRAVACRENEKEELADDEAKQQVVARVEIVEDQERGIYCAVVRVLMVE